MTQITVGSIALRNGKLRCLSNQDNKSSIPNCFFSLLLFSGRLVPGPSRLCRSSSWCLDLGTFSPPASQSSQSSGSTTLDTSSSGSLDSTNTFGPTKGREPRGQTDGLHRYLLRDVMSFFMPKNHKLPKEPTIPPA